MADYDTQTKESRDAAAGEAAKHATTLAVTALAELEAAPKLRYGRPPLTHFSLLLTAAEVAKLNATILDKQSRHETATREKAFLSRSKTISNQN